VLNNYELIAEAKQNIEHDYDQIYDMFDLLGY